MTSKKISIYLKLKCPGTQVATVSNSISKGYLEHVISVFQKSLPNFLNFFQNFIKFLRNFSTVSLQIFQNFFRNNANLSYYFSKAPIKFSLKFFNNFHKIISKCLKNFLKTSGKWFPNISEKRLQLQDFLVSSQLIYCTHFRTLFLYFLKVFGTFRYFF